jgi:hypothetical protein
MLRLLASWAVVVAVGLFVSDTPNNSDSARQKEKLAKLQQFVGAWRGVGQPQRGSTKNSWTEEADWGWSFGTEGPALVGKLPKGKFFEQLRLTAGDAEGEYRLSAKPRMGAAIEYSGKLEADQLVLLAGDSRGDLPRRISVRFVAGGDRMLMLLEKQGPATDAFARLAEVGYTRQGSGFGKVATQRECVVTGGQGTIEVSHNGKSYYVCCTGCRDYFNENAEKVLAEYAARIAAAKSK